MIKSIMIVLFVLSYTISYAQVGVNTTNPTKDLDVNGEVRIRTVPELPATGIKPLYVNAEGNVGTSLVSANSQVAFIS